MSRVAGILAALQRLVGGELEVRVPISPDHDELDAMAHAINVVVGELRYTGDCLRRARDEAEAANRAKTVFLRNVSHELRTPLTAILSAAELLRAADLTAERRDELIQRVCSNGRALQSLVDDLLDFSKLEADQLQIDLRSLAPSSVALEVVNDLQPEAERKGLELRLEPSPNGERPVLADRRRVRQILANLVGNALKFTARGSVQVRLGFESGMATFDVADTGIGLSAEQAERLFQPFAQADPQIAERYGGSGLGLALSRRLARGMGGELRLLRSQPGDGATFRLSLPTTAAPEAPVAEKPERTRPNLKGARLLLAEDNPDIRASTVDLLAMTGAAIDCAEDGKSAFERGLSGAYDLVIMDVRMPDVDGLEATRRLRAAGITVPIVALTADAVPEHRQECLAAGCTAYLTKPFNWPELFALLHDLLPRP